MENISLVFLAAFGEAPTGQPIAKRIFGLPFCANLHKTSYVNGEDGHIQR
jgi:hypothetical protein